MTIKNVVVAGGGVLGSQIAYQAAYKGFAVTVWLRSEGSIERAKPKFEQLRQTYLATLEAMKSDPAAYCRGLADTPELSVDEIEQLKQRAQQAFESVVFTTSYEDAAKDADLVIWTADPFDPLSQPTAIIIRGQAQPLTSRQIELRDRYKDLSGPYPPAYSR